MYYVSYTCRFFGDARLGNRASCSQPPSRSLFFQRPLHGGLSGYVSRSSSAFSTEFLAAEAVWFSLHTLVWRHPWEPFAAALSSAGTCPPNHKVLLIPRSLFPHHRAGRHLAWHIHGVIYRALQAAATRPAVMLITLISGYILVLWAISDSD